MQTNQKDAEGLKIGVWTGVWARQGANVSFADTYEKGILHGLSMTWFINHNSRMIEYFEYNFTEGENIVLEDEHE
jgi:hypothetical protein